MPHKQGHPKQQKAPAPSRRIPVIPYDPNTEANERYYDPSGGDITDKVKKSLGKK